MSVADEAGSVASEGLTLSELVERRLEGLRKVDGVSSAKAYARQRREPLNKSMIKVKIAGKAAVTVHCKQEIPDLLLAADEMVKKVVEILGCEAVAEGQRRADAEREAAAPVAATRLPVAASGSDQPGQPLSFFQLSARIQELDAKIKRADERVREADGPVRAALQRVAAEEKAVQLAQQRLANARAAVGAAKEPLNQAKAAAAELRDSLAQVRSKRQRLGDDAGASFEPAEDVDTADMSADTSYKEYSLETFRKLEAEEVRRRSVVPERGLQRRQPRTGKLGALHHWRRGLIGAIQSWADGSLENVVILVLWLINHFEISEQILELLGGNSGGPRHPGCKDPPLPRRCPRRSRSLIFIACLSQVTRSTHTSWSSSKLRCMPKRRVPRRRSEGSTNSSSAQCHLRA